MNPIRRLAWAYAVLFFAVVASGWVPAFKHPDGSMFGLFFIDPIDDILHGGSAIWAAVAAWRSTRASTLYFKIFGAMYFLDAVVGMLFGQGYLDGGIFRFGPTPVALLTRFLANLPHIVIGGLAVYIGYVLSARYAGISDAKAA